MNTRQSERSATDRHRPTLAAAGGSAGHATRRTPTTYLDDLTCGRIGVADPTAQLIVDRADRSEADSMGEEGIEGRCGFKATGRRSTGEDEPEVDVKSR